MSIERLERIQRLLLELFEKNEEMKSAEKALDDLPKEASASESFVSMCAFERKAKSARKYQETILEELSVIVSEECEKARKK